VKKVNSNAKVLFPPMED